MPKKTGDNISKRQDKRFRVKDKSGRNIYSAKSVRLKEAERVTKPIQKVG